MDNKKILSDLFRAYYDARKHKRKTLSAMDFEVNYESNIFELGRELVSDTYKIGKSICFISFKPLQREIFAADFRDRIIHHLIYNYINPFFECSFINDCYSCRIGRGTSYGIKRLNHFIRSCSKNYKQNCYILKLDIKGYFMSIDKDILYKKLAERIKNCESDNKFDYDWLMSLIHKVIFHDPTQNCTIKGQKEDWRGLPKSKSLFGAEKNKGLPIGNLTSQLFGNVYLNKFDHFIKHELGCKYYGRYVDDMVIVHQDREYLKSIIPIVKKYLKDELFLELHPKKIYLQNYKIGVRFLGVFIKPYRIYIRNQTKGNFLNKIKYWNQMIKKTAETFTDEWQGKFLSSLNSYLGLIGTFNTYKLRHKILKTYLATNFNKFVHYTEDCRKVMPTKEIIIFCLIPFFIFIFFGFNKALADTYSTNGIITSANFLPAGATSTFIINSVSYTASAIPAGTSMKIQFSSDDPNASERRWYDSDGLQDAFSNLSLGTNTINLQGLSWNKVYFFYRIWFVSDGVGTPILDAISLTYSIGSITYPTGGYITSKNLLPINSSSTIHSLSYNASAMPAGTGLEMQFSYDNLNWYDATGVSGGHTVMTSGSNSIDLSPLVWTKEAFYYRVWFISDGSGTPVLDSIRLSFDLIGGIAESSYMTDGIMFSEDLIPGGDSMMIDNFSYTASAIPAGTSIKILFSYDNFNWYSSGGVLNTYTTLSAGTNAIDLRSLNWTKSAFYYKVWFISDGLNTPVLDSVSLSTAFAEEMSNSYSLSGTMVSGNLLANTENTVTINSFSYDVSSLPADTSIQVQFSQDGSNWYGSSGTIDTFTNLLLGTSTINLTGLNWNNSQQFYYKLALLSNGSSTPVLDSVDLNYSPVSSVIPILSIGKSGHQISTTTIPVTNMDLGGAYTFIKADGSSDITGIVLTQKGSLPATDITNVKLWTEATTTCSATKPLSGTTQFGTGSVTFTDNIATTTGTLTVDSNNVCLYVTYNIDTASSELTLGKSIDLEISNPTTDVTISTGTISPTTKVNIPHSTIITDPTLTNSVLSLKMDDPLKDPTVFYLKDSTVWKKEGEGNPIRLTNPNLKVHSLVFTDLTGANSGGTVKMDITISNVDIGDDPNFLSVTRTYGTTATVRAWRGN